MDDSFGVHVEHALGDLISHVLDVISVHAVSVVPDHVHQVLSAVFSDEVQVIESLWVRWAHNGLQFNNLNTTNKFKKL
jgi:hypothetical protein